MPSRYQSVPGSELRRLPVTEGEFRHTLAEGERLDHLAYTYYGDPQAYWRICDANPEILSPLALVDDEPVRTTFFPVEWPEPKLLTALARQFGVLAVKPADEGVVVIHNILNADTVAVRKAIEAAGFLTGLPQERGRVGASIVIPPATGGGQ
ncbi:tail protein X [Streptomyces sp. NPDC002935]|uniref:tail protein X n=1 Tax=unclassified Streptomyces TaxID=2593676 RepID=UPI003333EDF0